MTDSRPDAGAVPDPSNVPAGRRSFLPILVLSAVVAFVLAVGAITLLPGIACACTTAPVPTPEVTSPVEGVVIAVDGSGLTQVRGFTLRTSGGFAFDFSLGALENATAFSPSHLAEHMATSQPIRAYFRIQDGRRVVYRLEDASPASS